MPRKIRELIKDLKNAGFTEVKGGGKGDHRKFSHQSVARPAIIDGRDADDAKPYQEKHVREKIQEAQS